MSEPAGAEGSQSMDLDLDASPLPEHNEPSFEERVDDVQQPSESVQTMLREQDERRRRLKIENQNEGPKNSAESFGKDFMHQSKAPRGYERIRELPQGWLHCSSYGQPIGYMIPSKVPLDESYNDLVTPGRRYSPEHVISSLRRNACELGLVIDLTNTTRYYSPVEWRKLGIKYRKIRCRGRDVVPDNESVNKFVYKAMQYLKCHKHSRKFILVHCTHGHNLTGFMIINFLMRTQVMHVAEAIHLFAHKRPPGIYKQEYIEALFAFYHYAPENLNRPSSQGWKSLSGLDLNGEAVANEEDIDMEVSPLEHVEAKMITNDDVLGDPIPPDEEDDMRLMCYQYFALDPAGRGNMQFPGSHPVSLNRENLQLLRQRYYCATWKAAGTRYMMLIMSHGCYLIDQRFSFRRVQMRFPMRNMNGFHDMTLLDGEMIIDRVPASGLRRRYLIYDLVALRSCSVVKLPFSERLRLLEEQVVGPRNYERSLFECDGRRNPVYRYDMEPFSVDKKDFWMLAAVTKLLNDIIPNLSHKADGLIFQGLDDPYVPRTHESLLKWDYPEMNSVDFLFEAGSADRELLFLFEGGKTKLMEGVHVIFRGEEDASSLSGKIIKCSCDSNAGGWVFMCIRLDKSTPSDINTYREVMRSITDNVTEDVLLNEIAQIVRLPLYATSQRMQLDYT